MPLIMCLAKDGDSCLYIAAQNGHAAVVEVGAGGGRQRDRVCDHRTPLHFPPHPSVFACVCVCVRERESVCVCERERGRVCGVKYHRE